MPNLNKVFLMGNLTKDPTMHSSKSGGHFCRFTLAVNRRYTLPDGTQKEEAEFIEIVISGRTADSCFNNLRKGSPAFVEGRIHLNDWVDKNNVTHRGCTIYADKVEFLAPRSHSSASGGIDSSVEQAFRGATRPDVPPPPVAPLQGIPSEDLPDSLNEVF